MMGIALLAVIAYIYLRLRRIGESRSGDCKIVNLGNEVYFIVFEVRAHVVNHGM